MAAQGMARAAELLAKSIPLGYHKRALSHDATEQDEKFAGNFCSPSTISTAKNDLATVFMERCLEFCTDGGTAGLVLPQNWLFLTSYRKLRERKLLNDGILALVGSSRSPGAFETISA